MGVYGMRRPRLIPIRSELFQFTTTPRKCGNTPSPYNPSDFDFVHVNKFIWAYGLFNWVRGENAQMIYINHCQDPTDRKIIIRKTLDEK